MNLSNVPEWAWIVLAVVGFLVAQRNGWLDGLLNKPRSTVEPTRPPMILFQTPPDAQPTAGQPVPVQPPVNPTGFPMVEKLSLQGPLRITVSGGKIDVTA